MYGTLQWAIRKAMDTPDNCIIEFNIPGTGPFTILLNYTLPAIENKSATGYSTGSPPLENKFITIDATTQPGYSPENPQIILDGGNLQITGLYFNNVKNSGVKGMIFKNFISRALLFNYCDSFEISNNYFINNGSPASQDAPFSIRITTSNYGIIKGNFIGMYPAGVVVGNNANGIGLTDSG